MAKANKFQKSVQELQERMEQEAERYQVPKPVEPTPPPQPKAPDPKSIKKTADKKKEPKKPLKVPNIDEYLRQTPARVAKNKTFYLDTDVIDAVKETARARDVTDSKLVNDILSKVLGLA